jgi:hypothetical protein
MGREVRRVPENWEHPKDKCGRLIPLLASSFSKKLVEWKESHNQWQNGLIKVWSTGKWRSREKEDSYEDYVGRCPMIDDYMPEWSEFEKTHLQMYEDTSEGTPISPVMKTPEELAHWLADNKASAFARETATYEQWLSMIGYGFSVSMVVTGGKMMNGVSAYADRASNSTGAL